MYLCVILFLTLTNAFSGMVDEYQLLCPDNTLAVSKGLHACCEEKPFVYCVLCARFTTKDYFTSCAVNCNGTIIQEEPYCQDCKCREPLPASQKIDEEEQELDDSLKYRGCPYMMSKAKKEGL